MLDPQLRRRTFLRGSSLTLLGLALFSLSGGTGCGRSGEGRRRQGEDATAGSDGAAGAPVGQGETAASGSGAAARKGGAAPYGDWRDVYAERWSWDRIARCSHTRANCLSACAWSVYVKDGIVWREEQAESYDEGGRAGAPDFFPRGCQKGACYSEMMAAPSRLRYPLVRVGKRGSGRWKRVRWEEALDRVADGLIDAATKHGPETVVHNLGSNFDLGPGTAAELRLIRVLRASIIDTFAGIGDMAIGCLQTWGMFLSEGSSDDWFGSDYIVIWSGNPVYTRIPDMHFLTEARYRGARLVVVGPDYNATAVHADLWLNPRVESDPALALAMAQVILSEGLADRDYVCEQTDLPFLVRSDTGRFLRESDVEEEGRADAFYVWDERRQAKALAPGTQGMRRPTLALGGMQPALEGRWTIALSDGGSVEVEPVYEILSRALNEHYRPELAEQATGVAADLIRAVARGMARAGAAMIYASVGACKHYHSDLMHRSMALLMALTGNQGKAGGGLRIGAWWGVSGFDDLGQMIKTPWWQKLLLKVIGRPAVRDVERYITEFSRTRPITPLLPWLCVHAGYAGTMGKPSYNDAGNPLGSNDALQTAIEKGWVPIYPAPGKDPKVLLVSSSNPLRRWPAPRLTLEHLWPKLDLIVSVNTQMSETGMYSDVLLPAAGYYEKVGIKYAWCFLPYLVLADKAVEPLGESRDEWWIFGSLARHVQQRALSRAVTDIKDAFGEDLDLTKVFDAWSEQGSYDPSDSRPAMDYVFTHSEVCEGTTWDQAVERGLVPVKRNGHYSPVNHICSDVDPQRPLHPQAWQVEGKESWPTLTGRQQFYLDQDWYLAAGEALPVHKDPPPAGGPYPLRLTGGHTRWSIHAIWRSSELMQRLQRGEPVLYMNIDDARARGLRDGDRVRVFNDVGAFQCMVKPSAAVQPGQVIIYHAWEPYQFAGHDGQQEPIASPWKSLHLAGDYGQLHYRFSYGAPNFGPRGATVEVEPA